MRSFGSLGDALPPRRIAALWLPLAALASVYVCFAIVSERLPWKLPRLCPFYQMTGRDCPLCGFTRGLGLLSRGRMQEAFRHHARSLISGGIGVALLGAYLLKRESN